MVRFHRDRKQLSGCQGLGAEGKSRLPKGTRELPRDDGNVLCGNDIAFAQLYTFVQTHLIMHLPMADFTACKLLLNKADLNIQYSGGFFPPEGCWLVNLSQNFHCVAALQ